MNHFRSFAVHIKYEYNNICAVLAVDSLGDTSAVSEKCYVKLDYMLAYYLIYFCSTELIKN